MRRVELRVFKGMVKYRLIEDGDKILVGLSGGKDSLALLELFSVFYFTRNKNTEQ